MKRYLKIIGKLFLIIIAVLLVLLLAIQLSPVQTWLAKRATNMLSHDLKTEVKIDRVGFSLFDKLDFNGFLVKDKHNDTLLYAGVLRVRITDWFFLKQKAELKYIGLENAVVNLNRKTATWNYQFIVDHFASKDTSVSNDQPFYVNLKKVNLQNVRFVQIDAWTGENLIAKVDELLLDANKGDVGKGRYSVKSIVLERPSFSIIDYDGLRPDSIAKKDRIEADKPTLLKFNPGILVKVDSIKIHNGMFSVDADNDKPSPNFDGSHIKITQINASFHQVSFNKDTLKANAVLACKERSGFEIRKLKSQLRITPEIIEFAKLDLITNKSHLGDYYAMRFKHFNDDFKDYTTKVVMDARVKDAKVNSDDVGYFAPELKHWKKEVQISGSFLGSVANFNIKNLFLHSQGTTSIEGNFAMKGLPDIDKTIISFPNGIIKTDANDLSVFIPPLKEVDAINLPALGTVYFRGGFLGTLYDFKTSGVLSTAIGAIDASLGMKFPDNGEPTYDGILKTTRFSLGKLVNSNMLGLVDFNGKIAGSSFNMDRINTSIDGNFTSLEFNGYNYTNITTNGTLVKNFFKGDAKIDDPNLDLTSTIEVNLSKKQPSVNILGDLHQSNFKNLKLTNNNVELTGLLDMNFTGANIDEFLGSAKILNANLLHEKSRLSFDSLVLTTSFNEVGEKVLSLSSNEFGLTFTGKHYKVLDLPDAFKTYLNHYFPSYFAPPVVVPSNQDFTVTLATKDFSTYAKVLDKKLGGLDYANFEGSINTQSNKFGFTANIPSVSYDKYLFTDANIIGEGSLDTLKLIGDITNIKVGDSLNFPNTNINVFSSHDYSDVKLKTKADNTLNEANLNAGLTLLEDGVKIKFKPSFFVLNDKKWNLENAGDVVITRNSVSAENVKFTQGLQEIKVETDTQITDSTADNLIVKLKDVVVGDVTSLFMKNPQFEGLANGTIRLSDFFGEFKADATIKAEQFRMDADSIGQMNVTAGFNAKKGIVSFKAISPNKNYSFVTDGSYNIKDTTGQALYVNTQLSDAKVSFVQRFLGDIFSDMSGNATGNLIVKGDPNNPILLGKVNLRNVGLKVNYTQVYYKIDSAIINFNEDGIDIGELIVKDRYKNTGKVKGKVLEKGFKDMYYDFVLSTNKLLLIDTKPKDNKQFYGKAIGKATLSFKGPEKSAYLKMNAEANDSSHIYIPNSIDRENGEADFIVFKKYGKEMQAPEKKSNFDLTVDLDLTSNKFVAIDVILDEQTGDIIKAVGNGRLKIHAGTSAPFTMKGRYNIEQGSYNFNFQSFIRKPFILLPEAGNYIEWNGSPMNADIHIDAQYVAEGVTVGDLLSTQQTGISSSTKSYRGQVLVIASLRNQLSKPDISFKLAFPQSSPVKSDPVFMEFVNKIESDQNEMLSQATSLIVFNTFAPYGQGLLAGNAGNSFNSLGVNTISQLLTKQVNTAVTNLLFKLTGDRSLHFDLGTSLYSSSSILDQSSGLTTSSGSSHLDRTNINFKIGKSFFNDNVIITYGGDLDFSAPGATSTITNGNFQWLPDLNVELVITKDKRLRAIVFSKNSLDISGSTLGRVNRQGFSLSYRKDFDTFLGIKQKRIKIPYRDTLDTDVAP